MDIQGFILIALVVLIIGAVGAYKPPKKVVLRVFGDLPRDLTGFTDLAKVCAQVGVQPSFGEPIIDEGTRVFITGSPSPKQLKELCERLRASGSYPVVIKDAITNFAELKPVLNELNEHQRVHVVVSAQVIDLLKKVGSRYVYAFPKADCTTTVALLFAGGKKVLVIERLRNPFKGFMTLPGGFLNVLLESLPQCAVRELHEEVFSKAEAWLFQPSDLRLVDVRSEPGRDPRGHIVDHGYAWLVPSDREAEIIAAMCKGDDAAKVWLEDTATALKKGLAFDHNELLQAAVELFGIKLD